MKVMHVVAPIAALPLLTGAGMPPTRMPLKTAWMADYGENSCRMIGEFGEGERTAILAFEQIAPDDALSMLVLSNQFRDSLFGTRTISAYFMPQAKAGSRHGQSVTASDPAKTPGALWSTISFATLPTIGEEAARDAEMRRTMFKGAKGPPVIPPMPTPAEFAAMKADQDANRAAATAIQIIEPGDRSMLLETGPLAAVLDAMKGCARSQLQRWGIDPAVDAKIAKRAKLRDWWKLISPNDYPVDSLRKGEESQLAVRMLVDAQGRPTDCTPVTPVNPPTFGKVVCARFMKGRVDPAELEDGTLVPSYVISHIRFVMP